jgi:hypothetical protein
VEVVKLELELIGVLPCEYRGSWEIVKMGQVLKRMVFENEKESEIFMVVDIFDFEVSSCIPN